MEPTSNNDDQFLEERGAIFDIRNINIINPRSTKTAHQILIVSPPKSLQARECSP
jgi:hypothetical protein